MQLEKINNIFGISLIGNNQNIYNSANIQLSPDIYQNILSKIENQYGSQFLTFSISPEKYMKYKNGKVSSMIKSNTGGITEHVGFETVEMVNLLDSVFMEIERYYTTHIINEFNYSVNQIFQAIDAYQSQMLNQAFNFKEQELIEKLASFKDFFEDIRDELGEITISSIRASSYITNLISIRRENYRIYNFFIEKLNSWINIITLQDRFGNYINNPINFQELEKDFYFARQSISTYMICLIYEHIISGNIDTKSKNKIISKLESFLDKFNNVEKYIKNVLIQRDASNKTWNWYYHPYKQYDSKEINWFLEKSKNNSFETNIVNKIFNKSANILKNITIEQSKDNKTLERNI